MKCNYDYKHFRKKMPFYNKMLDLFKELRSSYPRVYKSVIILWNNNEITNLSFGNICLKKISYFVQDLLNKDGKFLSLENIERNIMCNQIT